MTASRAVLEAAPGLAFLDSGASDQLREALRQLSDNERSRAVLNAVPLGTPEADGLFEALAETGAGAVLSPRAADLEHVATTDELAGALLEGARRATEAGVTGALFLDVLAYPPALDLPRWRRSVEVSHGLASKGTRPLVAVGNIGHGAPPRLRPWLRLIYLALALGAGAGALLLPVEESRLVDAARLIEGDHRPANDLDAWLLDLARSAERGLWALPRPPASAPDALLEAWALCAG